MPLGTPPPFCLSVRRPMRSLPPLFLYLLASTTASTLPAAEAPAPGPQGPPNDGPAEAQPVESNILTIEPLTGEGHVEQDFADGISYFRYGVVVRYQGIELVGKPAFSFQGHPEASPGPHDIAPIFDRFISLMAANTK